MVCDGCNCYFSLWAIFYTSTAQILPFYPVTAQKRKISKKWKKKKKTGDMIILHKCNKNLDHRLYCSWDMACDECNCYFSFWAIFCPFTFLIAQKMKISKKMKKRPGDIIISHMCTKNHDHMLYCSWDMAHDTCNFDFSFWAIFCPFTHAPHLPPPPHPLISQKIKILENERKTWRYHHFTQVNQILWLDDVWFLKYGARQEDGQMDGRKKWHIEVGASPKNLESWN